MKTRNIALLVGCFAVGIVLSMGCDDPTKEVTVSNSANAKIHNGIYEITAENFEEVVLNSSQPVLLDFWATWCGPCVALTPTMEKIASEYDGQLIVGKINVDEQESLALKYEIDSIPALLYVQNGEVVKSSVGLQSQDKIEADIDEIVAH